MFLLAQGAAADLSPWAQFGLAGIVIGALFFYIWQKDKSHFTERESYRSDIKEIAAKHDEVAIKIADKFETLQLETLKKITGRDLKDE